MAQKDPPSVRLTKWGQDSEDLGAFPILALLARHPMNSREMAEILYMSHDTVRERCARMEKLGWVVRRARDNRWVLIVRLVAVGPPQPGEPPPAKASPTSRVVLRPPKAPEPVGTTQVGEGGSAAAEPSPVAVAGQPARSSPGSELVAAHFKVPLSLDGEGCSTGKVTPCHWCAAVTPLRYGERAICPKCARLKVPERRR